VNAPIEGGADLSGVSAVLSEQRRRGGVDDEAARALLGAIEATVARDVRTQEDVEYVLDLVRRHGCVDYARAAARARARKARACLEAMSPWMPPSTHREFLFSLVNYAIDRDH
jgi:geranylgeranyl diphosphate synthase type II